MPHPFGFDADITLMGRRQSPVGMELRRIALFLRILVSADVVHYNWGRTFFPDLRPRPSPAEGRTPRWLRRVYRWYGRCFAEVELRLLRLRGIRLVVTFQGNDARQVEGCRKRGAARAADAMESVGCTADEDAWKRRVISRFDRFADSIFCLNPDLCWVLPPRTRFLPYLHWDSRDVDMRTHAERTELVVAHAPSVRAQKGTDAIIEAIEQLRREGVPIRLKLIEGMAHRDCVRSMTEADIFVDQLLYGWYGGAAVEAMSLGIPTIAYIDERDLRWIPPAMAADLPIINATPETIRDRLLELHRMGSDARRERGRASHSFVSKWHDPDALVRIVAKAYR